MISLYEKETPESLHSALESVKNQTLQPSQVVIVFDGPIPKELESIIDEFHNQFNELKILKLDKNMGLGKALNFGILHCKNELVARMDTDDICYPSRFEQQVNFMSSHTHISVVGSSIQEFKITPGDIDQFKTPPSNYEDLKKFAKFRNPLNHPSVMFRKSNVINAGSYKHMPLFEDYFLWVRMLVLGYKIANLNVPLLHSRIGNDMIGRRHGVSYLIKELNFLLAIRSLGYINFIELIISIFLKLPLRLLPKSTLEFLYKKALR